MQKNKLYHVYLILIFSILMGGDFIYSYFYSKTFAKYHKISGNKLKEYFNYEFILRKKISMNIPISLINRAFEEKMDVFGTAIGGKDGFMFYNFTHALGRVTFSKEDKVFWENYLRKKINSSLEIGKFKYYLMIAPNKSTIYPEKMFFNYYPQNFYRNKNGLAQIRNIIKENNWHENFIDLAPKLIEGKQQEMVYFRTDTHWNAVGVLIALSELFAILHKNFPEQVDAFRLKKYLIPSEFKLRKYPGDLLYFASLVAEPEVLSKYTKQEASKVSFTYSPTPNFTDFTFEQYINQKTIVISGGSIINLRVWVIGDSFSVSLGNSIPDNIFKQIVFIKRNSGRNPLSEKMLVEIAKKYGSPDVIVDEFVERDLYTLDRVKKVF